MMNMQIHRVKRAVSAEWRGSLQNFVHQTTKRIHVGSCINRSSLTLLRAHIQGTAERTTVLGNALFAGIRLLFDLRKPEIEYLGAYWFALSER